MFRFTLFGFPVAIHWMFWVTAAFISGDFNANTPEKLQALILFILAALVSIMIHELGHALLMRHYGARASILLYAFGGLAIPDRGFKRVQQILVSLAGPVVQIVAGILVMVLIRYLSPDIITVRIFLDDFVVVSLFWGILNLIPIYPLDGGHILAGILGPRRLKVTFTIGIVCAAAICLYMLSKGSIFNALLFGMLAYENFQRLRGDSPSSFLHPR